MGYTILPTDTITLPIQPKVAVSGLMALVAKSIDPISYWVGGYSNMKRHDNDGSSEVYQYHITTEDHENEMIISVNTIIDGLKKLASGNADVSNRHVNYAISDIAQGLEGGYIDGDTIDIIVQLGLFGEVVYG
jgi:hypothetical protein